MSFSHCCLEQEKVPAFLISNRIKGVVEKTSVTSAGLNLAPLCGEDTFT